MLSLRNINTLSPAKLTTSLQTGNISEVYFYVHIDLAFNQLSYHNINDIFKIFLVCSPKYNAWYFMQVTIYKKCQKFSGEEKKKKKKTIMSSGSFAFGVLTVRKDKLLISNTAKIERYPGIYLYIAANKT